MSGDTPEPEEATWVEIVRMKIEALETGRVEVVVQNGRVTQIRNERVEPDLPASAEWQTGSSH